MSMASSAGGLYTCTSSNRVRLLENEWLKEFNNFKSDLEDYEMTVGLAPKAFTSAQLPVSSDHFRKMRQQIIDRALQVPEGKPLKIQAEAMRQEMSEAMKSEYNSQGVAFILLDFFVNSIRESVVCRYKHLLRWKRFIRCSRDMEKCYPEYKQRLSSNLCEFNDFVSRANRLSVARDGLLFNKFELGFNVIQEDDMQIYSKWLITYLHAIKKFNQFYKVVQWVHLLRRGELTFEAIDAELQAMEGTRDSEYEESGGGSLQQKSGPPTTGRRSRYDDARTSFSASSVYTVESHLVTGGSTGPAATNSAAAASSVAASSSNPANVQELATASNPIYVYQRASMLIGEYDCEPNANESRLEIPYLTSCFQSLSRCLEFWVGVYGLKVDVEMIESAADEMDLFSKVHKLFPRVFSRQEEQLTFPVYDTMDSGKVPWGKDTSDHAVLKDATWIDHVTLVPRPGDAGQVKFFTQLRSRNNIDELMRAQWAFVSMKEVDQVQRILKYQATSLRINRVIEPSSVASHRCENSTHKLFLEIYTNDSLFALAAPSSHKKQTDQLGDSDFEEMEEELLVSTGHSASAQSSAASSRKKQKKKAAAGVNSYDYNETLQLLGLDDGDADSDTVNLQGGYLSFLHLRHLRIRDLKRNCLSTLNYFRSIERSLTVNDSGVSLTGTLDQIPQDKHDLPEYNIPSGPNPLDSHAYLYRNPADHQLHASRFMDLEETENFDDFYFVGNKSEVGNYEEFGTCGATRVNVQDDNGFFIMYNVAVDDFNALQRDLLLLGTFFIQKERESFKRQDQIFKTTRKGGSYLSSDSIRAQESHELSKYSHEMVDRMGVLFDLWSCETLFQEKKQQLVDLYMECYHHTLNVDDQRRLAQTIVDIIHLRPRIDPEDSYFVKMYRAETVILNLKIELLREMIEKHVESQRDYVSRICREGDEFFGMPMNIIPKQPVFLHNNMRNLQPMYLLEFHPSLSHVAGLETYLRQGFQGAVDGLGPKSVSEHVILNKVFLEKVRTEWDTLSPYGGGYSVQIQKELFAEMYIEDPLFVCEVGHSFAVDEDPGAARKPVSEKQTQMVSFWSRLLEIISLRHRIMESSWESEVMSRLYRNVCSCEKLDEFHLYMRLNQFEYGQAKDRLPPPFLCNMSEEDSTVDRYIPSFLNLAIHELDDNQVGAFNFRSREGLVKVMSSAAAVENLQITLMSQICSRNILQVCSELQMNAKLVFRPPYLTEKQRRQAATSKKAAATSSKQSQLLASNNPFGVADLHDSEKAALAEKHGAAAAAGGKQSAGAGAALRASHSSSKHQQPPTHVAEAFISVQLEKAYIRDLMINEFVKKKSLNALLMRNQEEVEKLKRKLIGWFCDNVWTRVTEYSTKSQMMQHYTSILRMLEEHPFLRDNYFTIGAYKERKATEDDQPLGDISKRGNFVKRPRRVMSSNGKFFLNAWFIPHPSELMLCFRNLDGEERRSACVTMCRIVSSIHDILKILAAHSMAGCSYARLGSQVNTVSAAWGGLEGIGTEISEIQKQIDALENPSDSIKVAELLQLKRDTMMLEFETAVRYPIRDQFVVSKNIRGYTAISRAMHFALNTFINIQLPSLNVGWHLRTPLPLQGRDALAQTLFPWRARLDTCGSFSTMIESSNAIVDNMLLCFSPLTNAERQVANGEILGMSLLLEDILQTGDYNFNLGDDKHKSGNAEGAESSTSVSAVAPETSVVIAVPAKKVLLSKSRQPIEAYTVCQQFLLLWKRMEFLKYNWALHRLGNIKKLAKIAEFREFTSVYRRDIFYPTVRTLAKKYKQLDHYLNSTVNEHDPITIPRGCSEVELRLKITVKLLDTVECRLIDTMRKKMSLEHARLLTEKSREEGALPTDLWKKPAIKEQFTIIRPHIAEGFYEKVKVANQNSEEDDVIVINKSEFSSALNWLGNAVMEREKQNFESYSMFYENLLKHNARLLFKHEQERRQLIESMKDFHRNAVIDSQCRLGEECYSLLMEVTALRTQLAEKEVAIEKTEKETRDKVRQEFMEVVHDLFNASYSSRTHVDQYQVKFFNDASDLIQRTGDEVRRKIEDWKDKVAEADEFNKQTLTEYREKIVDLQQQKQAMDGCMKQQQAFYKWKIAQTRKQLTNQLEECSVSADERRRQVLSTRLVCEEELQLYRQQCVSLKKSLAASENSQHKLHSALIKEQKEKMEKEHEKQQRARSDKQMEVTRAANIENLLSKLEESEQRFRSSLMEKSRVDKANEYLFDKSQKTIENLRKNLTTERAVKQEAMSKLDELQSVIPPGADLDTMSYYLAGTNSVATKSRPQTANSSVVSTFGTSVGLSSRVKSAGKQRHVSSATVATSGYASMARPLTSEGRIAGGESQVTTGRSQNPQGALSFSRPVSAATMHRPKTSNARLQQGSNVQASRIYKQLSQGEPYYDHEAMVQLNKNSP